MADITRRQPVTGARRLTAWIGRRQQAWSDRIHAASDAVARDAGWTVTRQTGRLGFGGRTYRDPRFDQFHAERTGRGAWLMDTQKRLRGHALLRPRRVLGKAPAAYTTESIPAGNKTIIAHCFSGAADYYIADVAGTGGETKTALIQSASGQRLRSRFPYGPGDGPMRYPMMRATGRRAPAPQPTATAEPGRRAIPGVLLPGPPVALFSWS